MRHSASCFLLVLGLAASGCGKKDEPELATITYQGRVVDDLSEAPLADVDVTMHQGTWLLIGAFGTDAGPVLDSVRTDASGRFRVSITTPRDWRNITKTFAVRLRKEAYLPETPLSEQAQGQDQQNLVFRLKRQ